jgi:hypothetical protein
MVVYTPRNEYEMAVCQSLFWISYDFVPTARAGHFSEWGEHWFGVGLITIEEPLVVVG